MTFDQLKDKALSLPLKPGVYLMMDKSGTVIYVGKAKALKNRVRVRGPGPGGRPHQAAQTEIQYIIKG